MGVSSLGMIPLGFPEARPIDGDNVEFESGVRAPGDSDAEEGAETDSLLSLKRLERGLAFDNPSFMDSELLRVSKVLE